MSYRSIDPAVVIGLFLTAVLVIAFGVAHLVERASRFRIDMPD